VAARFAAAGLPADAAVAWIGGLPQPCQGLQSRHDAQLQQVMNLEQLAALLCRYLRHVIVD
jgi:hypothetical protein